jgi:hypothetical protein
MSSPAVTPMVTVVALKALSKILTEKFYTEFNTKPFMKDLVMDLSG